LIADADGNLFGTTFRGGTAPFNGAGTVFEIAKILVSRLEGKHLSRRVGWERSLMMWISTRQSAMGDEVLALAPSCQLTSYPPVISISLSPDSSSCASMTSYVSIAPTCREP